jgi:hypothetical protein
MRCILLGLILAASSLGAAGPRFVGSWKGDLEGLTAIRLAVDEHAGRLSGSIVFYLIHRDEKGARIDGDYRSELLRVATQGRRMTFEVKHHVSHGSPKLGPNVKFLFELEDENTGTLKKASAGDSLRLVRER